MIIHILIPRFWVVVEEQKKPELRGRPVIITSAFMEKTAAHSSVLMASRVAEEYGVKPGISLAHARQLCPEAVVLAPELPLYQGVWDDVMSLMLSYTPLVEPLRPGEAACDVAGCERLFGDPVFLAREMTNRIQASSGLPAFAGVASNRLVAELAAQRGAEENIHTGVAYVQPGREMSFLAPLPITSLPEIDPNMLVSFQVLGLKTIGHLAMITEAALAGRFGPTGRRLARYARGVDGRTIRPAVPAPAVGVTRPCDGGDEADFETHPDPHQALEQLTERLADGLALKLKQRRLAGRLLTLTVRAPRRPVPVETSTPSESRGYQGGIGGGAPRTPERLEQCFPNQDSRIHSMLPTPPQPGRGRGIPAAPAAAGRGRKKHAAPTPNREGSDPEIATPEPFMVIEAMERMAVNRPVNDAKTIRGLACRLLSRLVSKLEATEVMSKPGAELRLEMRHFAPPEQMALPGIEGGPALIRTDVRHDRLRRQEGLLVSRFGATPFRHLAAVDLDSVLEERRFQWGEGMAT